MLSESECQTDPDNQQFEVGTQTSVEVKDTVCQTLDKESDTIPTQTEANRNTTSSDCQTDEIVIKEKNEIEIEYKTVHTQTIKAKP